MKNFDLLNTEETPNEFHKAKLTIGISLASDNYLQWNECLRTGMIGVCDWLFS
jgi:hypothetical protein